jgi:hypothetical protein
MVVVDSERYLVAMLGERTNWVRNVRAAGGIATLLHGRREDVRLEEISADLRAPVLEAYLERSPGARAHIPVAPGDPPARIQQAASAIPVFRVLPAAASVPVAA